MPLAVGDRLPRGAEQAGRAGPAIRWLHASPPSRAAPQPTTGWCRRRPSQPPAAAPAQPPPLPAQVAASPPHPATCHPAVSPRYSKSFGAMDGLSSGLALHQPEGGAGMHECVRACVRVGGWVGAGGARGCGSEWWRGMPALLAPKRQSGSPRSPGRPNKAPATRPAGQPSAGQAAGWRSGRSGQQGTPPHLANRA